MVKGCQRRIVVLKDTGSDLFEEAYFILKEDLPESAAKISPDMVEEANRILSGETVVPKKRKIAVMQAGERMRWFLYGALLAASLITAVFTAVFCF